MNRRNGFALYALAFGAGLTAPAAVASTLGEALKENGIEAGSRGTGGFDREITSFAIENTADLFAIAFYWKVDAGSLPDTMRVEVLDKPSGTWTQSTLPGSGSITRIRHTQTSILLDTRVTPSAGRLIVLTRGLEPVARLDGWSLAPLADNAVVYQANMTHFASTHSAELLLYRRDSGSTVKLYPSEPSSELRRRYIDDVKRIYAQLGDDWFREHNHGGDPAQFDSRVLAPITVGADNTRVSFIVTFGNKDVFPASTPFVEVLVVCRELSAAQPHCSETEFDSVRRARPGLSNAQILEDVL